MTGRNHILLYQIIACLLGCGVVMAQKTEIDIRGMKSRSESDVLTSIGGRLYFVKEKPANSWRANDAAFMVKNILRADGYFEAEVTAEIEGERNIILMVDEGRRLSLGEVLIRGDENGEELAEFFKAPFGSGDFLDGKAPAFKQEKVEQGIEFVGNQLKSEGYWNARVNLAGQNIDQQTGKVDVELFVNRGVRFRIGQPTVQSPDGRGVKRSATTWEPFVGEWASTENVNGLRAAMVEAFNSRGYPDADISMSRRLGKGRYYPDFVIKLGVRVKLLEVHSKGLKRTKPRRIDEIMEPLEGDWYDEAAMNEKVKKLLQTGAFESVWIETEEVARKRIDATLHFREAKAKEITFSAGVDSFSGPLFRTKYTDRNIRGKLRAFSAGVELSARGVLGEVSLSDPWWRGTDILRTHRIYSLVKGYDGYTSYSTGYQSGWKMSLTDHYALDFTLGLSGTTTERDGLPSSLLGDSEYGVINFKFTQSWDYRDNPVVPKDGWHLSIPLEIGVAGGDEFHPYVRAGVDGGYYRPLSPNWHLGVGGFAEVVMPASDKLNFPIDLRLFNGGARSVRSFPERELGPSFAGDPYGGYVSWAINTELTRNITDTFKAVAFVDAGAVDGEYRGIREGGLEVAAGLGVRFDLPIGPVRLEYGHNMTQGAGEPSGAWHFAIGSTF